MTELWDLELGEMRAKQRQKLVRRKPTDQNDDEHPDVDPWKDDESPE